MNPAYLSAISALLGATIGSLASFGSSWVTQRTQLRYADREAKRAKKEALYADFITEASSRFGDALGHQKDDVTELVKLYALIGRMRLVSSRRVVDVAERALDTIIQTYLAPNRTLRDVVKDPKQDLEVLVDFGEACRDDLVHGWAASEP